VRWATQRREGPLHGLLRCFPRCSRFGPRCAPGCHTACRVLQRFAAIWNESGTESRASIGLGDRRKRRHGPELRPEEKTPQAVRACGVWGYGDGREVRPDGVANCHEARPEGLEPPTLGSEVGSRLRPKRNDRKDFGQACCGGVIPAVIDSLH
jgi:hypothetical protein